MSTESKLNEKSLEKIISTKNNIKDIILSELKVQRGIVIPLIANNIIWFAKITITVAFLGRLGTLSLAGGALGFTFANVTGFTVLNGLSHAMEPICGQAFGAKNVKLLHKTLVMATSLLLMTSIPIGFLWLNVEKILIFFGQKEDISMVAKKFLFYLLPGLAINSFFCPLRGYLSTQTVTIPIMASSCVATAFHVPINILLSRAKGLEGIAMAVWVSDLIVVVILVVYVVILESRREGNWKENGGWWEQGVEDWKKLLKLSIPCCLTMCLEGWCFEILMLLTGRLPNAKQALGVITIIFNFDFLVYSVILALSTCASIRVSNELGANRSIIASRTAYVSLGVSTVFGFLGGLIVVAVRTIWGRLFSHDKATLTGVKKMMLVMAVFDVVNFPLNVCGGILRGTARPWLGIYANMSGFYLIALPLGVILAFKVHLGLEGLLIGYVVGATVCLAVLLVFISRIGWEKEAAKAQIRVCRLDEVAEND